MAVDYNTIPHGGRPDGPSLDETTPLQVIEQLLNEARADSRGQKINWARVDVFHMDEYVGLDANHPASFRRYIRTRLAEVVHPLHFVVFGKNQKFPFYLPSKSVQTPIEQSRT